MAASVCGRKLSARLLRMPLGRLKALEWATDSRFATCLSKSWYAGSARHEASWRFRPESRTEHQLGLVSLPAGA